MKLAAITDWLAHAGLRNLSLDGPAVNEASRIERLCDALGRHLVMSQSFARAAEASRHELVSLGRHRLRGVREETELFGLAP